MYRGTDVGKGSESRSDLDQLFSTVRAWLTLFNTDRNGTDASGVFDLPSLVMTDWDSSEVSEWLDAFVNSAV
jgi:hypothetical protein